MSEKSFDRRLCDLVMLFPMSQIISAHFKGFGIHYDCEEQPVKCHSVFKRYLKDFIFIAFVYAVLLCLPHMCGCPWKPKEGANVPEEVSGGSELSEVGA